MTPLSLPTFDSVEIVRDTLSSLCLTTESRVHEIHIGRIQENFSRFDMPSEALKNALEDISTIREVEHLGKGYWLPTPTRLVSINGETSLLISIASTSELKRHYSSVRRAGLGRLVALAEASNLPIQSLKSWRGSTEVNSAIWVQTLIKSVAKDLRPSIASSDLEAFSVKTISLSNKSYRREPAWLPITDHRILARDSVNLLRSKLGPYHYRYFLGRLKSKDNLLEGPRVEDNLSFQYGLASLLGEPFTVIASSKANSILIRLPLIAPIKVRRLLSALCKIDSQAYGYVWVCQHTECWQTIRTALEDLGCEIINYE